MKTSPRMIFAPGTQEQAPPDGAQIEAELLRDARVIENEWIPLADGTRLAARIIMPSDTSVAHGAVLEYLPYRKRDMYRPRDNVAGGELARRGFVLVRVDIRGTGDSGGGIADEYTDAERADVLQVIDWVSRQAWCNGNVGMRGISYGAFTALQAAAMRPPALKAIIACCGTEDRYADDVHALGGACLNDNALWGGLWKTILVSPPDPKIVGEDRWMGMWLERLEAQIPLVAKYYAMRNRGPFYAAGGLEDYSEITCAVMAVGGVVDSYVNAIPRLLAKLRCPRLGIIGPWGHTWPQPGEPGPAVDWYQEEARWWGHWLAGRDTGIMREPIVRAFMHEAAAPEVYPNDVPGRWVAERAWPSPAIHAQTLTLMPGSVLGPEEASGGSASEARAALVSRQTVGRSMSYLCPTAIPFELPTDQAEDDARSLVFDGAPLEAPLEILGEPKLALRVRSDRGVATVMARLNEVLPDGRSFLVSFGVLSLNRRDSEAVPTPLEPGEDYNVRVALRFACHRFRVGSRIRVALSEGFWPLVWPSPENVTLEITTGASRLVLPARSAGEDVDWGVALLRGTHRDKAEARRQGLDRLPRIEVVDGKRRSVLRAKHPWDGQDLPQLRLDVQEAATIEAGVTEGDPTSAFFTLGFSSRYTRDGRTLHAETTTDVRATPDEFVVAETITAKVGEKRIFHRRWDSRSPRDLV